MLDDRCAREARQPPQPQRDRTSRGGARPAARRPQPREAAGADRERRTRTYWVR